MSDNEERHGVGGWRERNLEKGRADLSSRVGSMRNEKKRDTSVSEAEDPIALTSPAGSPRKRQSTAR